jgi:hypothetical protein
MKAAFLATLLLAGCSQQTRDAHDRRTPDIDAFVEEPLDLAVRSPTVIDPITNGDAFGPSVFDPDAACAATTETAKVEYQPVDIIWVVDNSISMKPAIDAVTAGINDFANLIAGKSFDYHIIVLSLRSATNPVTISGAQYYGVCVPPPLAATACGNASRFFQSSVNIHSTQPLEQILGTLGQTTGYLPTDSKGGEPWKAQLRAGATKTFVLVSDDNSRLSAMQFQHFAGGKDPFNTTMLPPGILDPSWGGLFDGFTFDAIYGWGSDTDATVKCTYANGTFPPSSGSTYTDLVSQTKGVRARICDDAASWKSFFSTVAQAVVHSSKLTCDLALPMPQQGTLDPSLVNVSIAGATGLMTLKKVAGAGACGAGGWYYDDDVAPQRVILCPSSCDLAQQQVTSPTGGSIKVHFGCQTIIG